MEGCPVINLDMMDHFGTWIYILGFYTKIYANAVLQSHDSLGIRPVAECLIGEKVWYFVYSTVKSDDNYTQQRI